MRPIISEVLDKTWTVEDGDVRFFLAAGEKEALLIDTGMTGLDVKAIAASLTELPVVLVNTHADMDHVSANDAFDSFYMHPSELPVYHRNHSYKETIHPVYEGYRFDLGGRELEVLHVPGHTPGSITILDKENRCLIGGDPIQTGGGIYMFGPYRDMQAYIFGLSHLLSRESEFDTVYPSHADAVVAKDVINKLIVGAHDIMDGKIEGIDEELHGMMITTYDIGISRFFLDRV
ncbi:MAG: MBL fold metallo-hydrolase [Eubacterium sp.]|nr:MBL fold metallo-hydrolase [Eubacterium sp.]